MEEYKTFLHPDRGYGVLCKFTYGPTKNIPGCRIIYCTWILKWRIK